MPLPLLFLAMLPDDACCRHAACLLLTLMLPRHAATPFWRATPDADLLLILAPAPRRFF